MGDSNLRDNFTSSTLHEELGPKLLEPDQTIDENELPPSANIEEKERIVTDPRAEASLMLMKPSENISNSKETADPDNRGSGEGSNILVSERISNNHGYGKVIPTENELAVSEKLAQPLASIVKKDISEINFIDNTPAIQASLAVSNIPVTTTKNGRSGALNYHESSPKLEAHAFQAAMGDFLLTGTFGNDEYEDSQDGSESNITSVADEEWEDFKISEPIHAWSSNSLGESDSKSRSSGQFEGDAFSQPRIPPFHPSMNCPGVVHVRLLRAQRLPCVIGSALQAIISLPPWKGRIRSKRALSYEGPEDADICARWDQVSNDETSCGDGTDKSGVCGVHSMLHAYNNEDTPTP